MSGASRIGRRSEGTAISVNGKVACISDSVAHRANDVQRMQLQLATTLHEEGGDGNGADVQHHAVRKWLLGCEFVQDVEVAAQQPNESVAESALVD